MPRPRPLLPLKLSYDVFCPSLFSDVGRSFPICSRYSCHPSFHCSLDWPKLYSEALSKAPSVCPISHHRQCALVMYPSSQWQRQPAVHNFSVLAEYPQFRLIRILRRIHFLYCPWIHVFPATRWRSCEINLQWGPRCIAVKLTIEWQTLRKYYFPPLLLCITVKPTPKAKRRRLG